MRYYNNSKAKYKSKKTIIDGITFASKKEAKRYSELKLLLKSGQITDLELQKEFILLPSRKGENGKVKERSVKYKADFVYRDKNGKQIVEDTKGFKTAEYIIKRKLMLYIHNIEIQEIQKYEL